MPVRPRLLLRVTPFARPSHLYQCHAQPIPLCRSFHATTCLLRGHVSTQNHYERLNVRHDATTADIKKSFYSLSRKHHPDVNRDDPDAAHTFSQLSEAYTILSDPSRRASYDRDVLRLHQHSSHAAPPRGSYHSANPAGGRAPSGLSRRRGTFRGPPPSFYRSGGWGDQSDKRRKAHEESTGTGNESAQPRSSKNTSSGWEEVWAEYARHGGMGPGGNPYGTRDEVPHFDSQSHTRTHRRQDERRWERQKRAVDEDDVEFEPQTSLAGHFLIILGILSATMIAPMVYLQFMRLGRKKRDLD